MTPRQYGPLHALTFGREAFDASPPGARDTLVLLHGYGVRGDDLSWLAQTLVDSAQAAGRALQVHLPAAPWPADGVDLEKGRLWFPIDMMALQLALLERRWDALAEYRPPGLDEATACLDGFLRALESESPVSQLFLGGFSQGALISANWAFQSSVPPRGLVLLSAMMMCEADWLPRLGRHGSLPVFQAHSPADPVVPYPLAKRLSSSFEAHGLALRFCEAPPGHYVHPSVAEQLSLWLAEQPARDGSTPPDLAQPREK